MVSFHPREGARSVPEGALEIKERLAVTAACRLGSWTDRANRPLHNEWNLVAQERVTRGPHGLVWITLNTPFSDGTVADRDVPPSPASR